MLQVGDIVMVRDPDAIQEHECYIPDELRGDYYYGISRESLKNMSASGNYAVSAVVNHPRAYTGTFIGTTKAYQLEPVEGNSLRVGCVFLENMLMKVESEEVCGPDGDLFGFLLEGGVGKC